MRHPNSSESFDVRLTKFVSITLMSCILLSGILFSEKSAAIDPQSCAEVRQEASTFFRNMNALFRVNQQLHLITEAEDGTPLSLFHAKNTPGYGVTMPDSCAVTDMKGLDKEVFLFMLAHEFSHGIINQPIDEACDLNFWDQFDESYWGTEDQMYMREVHHVNTDVFALKILNHFNIDQRKGVEGFDAYLRSHQNSVNPVGPHLCRGHHMAQFYGTSFVNGLDFTSGYLLENGYFLASFLQREYPNSSMIQDLETRFSERRGSCFYSSAEDRAESLANFRALETRANSTGASEERNESRR